MLPRALAQAIGTGRTGGLSWGGRAKLPAERSQQQSVTFLLAGHLNGLHSSAVAATYSEYKLMSFDLSIPIHGRT